MSDFREEEALGKAYDSQLLRRLMTLSAAVQVECCLRRRS